MLVGNGSVGKTQIARRLVEKEAFVIEKQHHSTHAISLLRTQVGDFEVNIWDFAGQDLYHATHRLFMQSRALFVLVWDFENENSAFHTWEGKQYENEKLQYWLEYARCFGEESPILVLQNKIDKAKQKDFLKEDKDKWKKVFPIVDFLQVSAESGEGFEALEYVLEEIFTNNPAFQQKNLPAAWVEVRRNIREQQKAGIKALSKAEFQAICEEEGCLSAWHTLLNYLHDTGVLYYREHYFGGQIILNQDWAIEAIYKVLNRQNKHVKDVVAKYQKGTLLYKNICEIWKNNTDEERALFMDFMLSAELAFETTQDKKWNTPFKARTFAVPSLLPLEKPTEVAYYEEKIIAQPHTQETVKYSFLPKVFIQRFIVLANRFSKVQYMWQKGLYLATQRGNAIVEADYSTRSISILSDSDFVIKKIKEELESIAQEGKIKATHYSPDQELKTEEFWGLKGLKKVEGKESNSSTTFDNFSETKTQNSNTMTLQDLKNLAENVKYVELFEILDTYFVPNPYYEYSVIKQKIQHQLNQGFAPNPSQVQALKIFLDSEKVKSILPVLKKKS
jgi:small GTP-binding protein